MSRVLVDVTRSSNQTHRTLRPYSFRFSAQPACLGNALAFLLDFSTLVNRRLGEGGRGWNIGHWTLLGEGLDRVKGYGYYPYYPYMAASRRRTEDPKTLTASRFSDETRFAGFAEANSPTDPRSNLSVSRLRKTPKKKSLDLALALGRVVLYWQN